jgi:hypothetical protein
MLAIMNYYVFFFKLLAGYLFSYGEFNILPLRLAKVCPFHSMPKDIFVAKY